MGKLKKNKEHIQDFDGKTCK